MDKFDLVRFTDNGFELDVRADSENETVWLTQDDMVVLFNRSQPVIARHIINIFKEGELDKNESMHFLHKPNSIGKNSTYVALYNLDVVISVGYRVKSDRGILFRKWANSIIKNYLLEGYAINQKRIETLNKVVDIQNRMLAYSLDIDKEELIKVIDGYTRALDLLDSYDHQTLDKPKGTKSDYVMSYQEAREIIDSMKFNDMSAVFGVEKEKGKLNGIIEQVYQDVFGQELYPSVEEKAAHL